MRPLSLDLRERILASYDHDGGTRAEIAHRFRFSLGMIKKLLQQRRRTGDIAPQYRFCGRKPMIGGGHRQQMQTLLAKMNDPILMECGRRPDSLVPCRPLAARKEKPFASLADFFHRVRLSGEELEAMIRAGAFDAFGETRTRQFWAAQYLLRTFNASDATGQSWLIPPADPSKLPKIPVTEPTRDERLQAEAELFGYAVSGHPLELFKDVAWDTYCPVNRLGEFVREIVQVCGLLVEQRIHHRLTGEPMKFLSLADWTGIIETELFAKTYKSYGLATVCYPVLEIEARVEPFENGRGFTLRALAARRPRLF
jgi:hypothetical protein